MQALIQALISGISADAQLAEIFGSAPTVYLSLAPESANLPLVILRVGTGRVSHDFSGDRITSVQLTFEVIAADVNIALYAAQRLSALLDNTTLPLSTGSLLACTLAAPIQPVMPGFNSLLNALYTAAVHLNCQVFNAA